MGRWIMLVAAGGAALAAEPSRAQVVQTTACAQYEVMSSDDQNAAIRAALKAEGEVNSVLDVTPGQLAMALSNGCPTNPDKRVIDYVRELARQQ